MRGEAHLFEAFQRHRTIGGINLHPMPDAPQLFAGDERRARSAEGIENSRTRITEIFEYLRKKSYRFLRRMYP